LSQPHIAQRKEGLGIWTMTHCYLRQSLRLPQIFVPHSAVYLFEQCTEGKMRR
jgi:hypothetical protein